MATPSSIILHRFKAINEDNLDSVMEVIDFLKMKGKIDPHKYLNILNVYKVMKDPMFKDKRDECAKKLMQQYKSIIVQNGKESVFKEEEVIGPKGNIYNQMDDEDQEKLV